MSGLRPRLQCMPSISSMSPIDFCYVRPEHIPIINHLCSEFFWPGIMSDFLGYPDFSVVAMYRKLIIGFGFMIADAKVNEAYITYLFTHPDWRRAKIGTFMLYQSIDDASNIFRAEPVYMPTCYDAFAVCRLDPDCFNYYHHFKKSCRVKNGGCHMRNRDLCRTYLAKIQRTPLYGCVCNSQHGDRCREIYVSTNKNPCVDIILKSEFSQKSKPPRISPPRISPPYRSNNKYNGDNKPDSNPDVDLNQEKIFSSTEETDNMDGYRRDGNGIILTTIHYPISHESGMKPPSETEEIESEQTSSEFDSSLMNSESWPRFHLHQKFSWKIGKYIQRLLSFILENFLFSPNLFFISPGDLLLHKS
ncbi:Cysteine-rich protein 2-binding protein [Nymphon striatum]|nr:Cysteine-rich protein 2-binding protein [Nymphon striatum]